MKPREYAGVAVLIGLGWWLHDGWWLAIAVIVFLFAELDKTMKLYQRSTDLLRQEVEKNYQRQQADHFQLMDKLTATDSQSYLQALDLSISAVGKSVDKLAVELKARG